MEFGGHWYLEGQGSDLTKVINSIYWTPYFGVKSLMVWTNC